MIKMSSSPVIDPASMARPSQSRGRPNCRRVTTPSPSASSRATATRSRAPRDSRCAHPGRRRPWTPAPQRSLSPRFLTPQPVGRPHPELATDSQVTETPDDQQSSLPVLRLLAGSDRGDRHRFRSWSFDGAERHEPHRTTMRTSTRRIFVGLAVGTTVVVATVIGATAWLRSASRSSGLPDAGALVTLGSPVLRALTAAAGVVTVALLVLALSVDPVRKGGALSRLGRRDSTLAARAAGAWTVLALLQAMCGCSPTSWRYPFPIPGPPRWWRRSGGRCPRSAACSSSPLGGRRRGHRLGEHSRGRRRATLALSARRSCCRPSADASLNGAHAGDRAPPLAGRVHLDRDHRCAVVLVAAGDPQQLPDVHLRVLGSVFVVAVRSAALGRIRTAPRASRLVSTTYGRIVLLKAAALIGAALADYLAQRRLLRGEPSASSLRRRYAIVAAVEALA